MDAKPAVQLLIMGYVQHVDESTWPRSRVQKITSTSTIMPRMVVRLAAQLYRVQFVIHAQLQIFAQISRA